MQSMKLTDIKSERGSTLLVALSTVIVLSLAGAGVLMNCTTRYNATSTQVKGWKDALYAAEAGGDLAYAKIRKWGTADQQLIDPATIFASADGWAAPAPSPLPSTNSWNLGYTIAPSTFGSNNGMSAKVTVDRFAVLPGSTVGAGYYRIRSIGTAQTFGFKRTGMDNRMDPTTKGDSLLRKIDFNSDHFIATYGYGDALPNATPTTANGKAVVAVANAQSAQVSRRIELIAIPVMMIEAGIKTGSFRGTIVDSYNSMNPPMPGSNPGNSYYGSNPVAPYAAYAVDAHDGDVVDGSSTFNLSGVGAYVWGDVSTNGGNATNANASGVVDNNVPFALPTASPGAAPIPDVVMQPYENLPGASLASVLTPPTRTYPPGTPKSGKTQTEFWYRYSSISNATINPLLTAAQFTQTQPDGSVLIIPANTPIDTTVNIYVTGDVNGLVINKGVTANIYFTGNMRGQASGYDNNNADGPVTWPAIVAGNGVVQIDPVTSYTDHGVIAIPRYTFSSYANSPLVSRAGHVWYYGISPADGSSRSINIDPPGTMWAAFYAPSHDFSAIGNPDFYGVMVCKTFYENGNCAFHVDRQLLNGGTPVDYRIASYVEDVR
jgi:hypothetical protein